MKKIIKHGKGTNYQTTCPICSCEFTYEYSDIFYDFSLITTTSYGRGYVTCPECGEKIYINKSYTSYWPSTPIAPVYPWWNNPVIYHDITTISCDNTKGD